MLVLFLCTSCKAPMPGRDMFGGEVWEVFADARTADAYALKASPVGEIVGPTTFATSARRDPMSMHKIWSALHDFKSYGPEKPKSPPVPEYLCRYGKGKRSVDLVLDVDEGYLSIYSTGKPETVKWISVEPRLEYLRQQFEGMLGRSASRDLRPNL